MTMKILIATGLYPPDIGGPATYTVFLEKHLGKHGIDLKVIPYSTVRKYPRFIKHILYTYFLLRSVRSCNVLYALDTVSVGLPVMVASMLSRKPYMVRVPGDYAWEQGRLRFGITDTLDEYRVQKTNKWTVRILASIQRKVVCKATHVVVPSEYMRGVVLEWGVSPERISRIYSVLKEVIVNESVELLREKYGYKDVVLLSAGRLVPWKGMSALIDVIIDLRTSGVPVSLEIFGEGACREELEEHVKRGQASSYIRIHNADTREELARRIKASNIFVLNTAYEGLSHILLEVMNLGTPIITTPVGGNTELIEHKVTGLFAEYNNHEDIKKSILEYIHTPLLTKKVSHEAHEYVQKFHEDVVVQDLIHLLKKMENSFSCKNT